MHTLTRTSIESRCSTAICENLVIPQPSTSFSIADPFSASILGGINYLSFILFYLCIFTSDCYNAFCNLPCIKMLFISHFIKRISLTISYNFHNNPGKWTLSSVSVLQMRIQITALQSRKPSKCHPGFPSLPPLSLFPSFPPS